MFYAPGSNAFLRLHWNVSGLFPFALLVTAYMSKGSRRVCRHMHTVIVWALPVYLVVWVGMGIAVALSRDPLPYVAMKWYSNLAINAALWIPYIVGVALALRWGRRIRRVGRRGDGNPGNPEIRGEAPVTDGE
jgi:hypothetical protein